MSNDPDYEATQAARRARIVQTRDLLPIWKREALRDARQRAKRARDGYEVMQGKDTAYAIAIRTMAEIHERALALYEKECAP